MSIGTLYVSHSTSRGEADFSSVPFHSASISWERESASTMSFKSPVRFNEGDRVRYQSRVGDDFGGQIYKVKKSISGDYQYEVISYLRLYHDKVTCSYKNKTASDIMKKVLKLSKNDFSTAGVRPTTAIHSSLKWENKSIWEIACQLCWLEHEAGFETRCQVNSDGVLEFGLLPGEQEGYTFTEALDYSEEHDSSDLITNYSVTFQGKTLATATSDKQAIATWGYVSEVEECQAETPQTATTETKSTVSIKAGTPKVIVQVLQSILKDGMTDTQKVKALFNWFKQHCVYSYYYNCSGNSLAAFKRRRFNCANGASLFYYLCQAINIKCRVIFAYNHEHYWNQVYLNGKWVVVDVGRGRTGSQSYSYGSHWGGCGGSPCGVPCARGW